MKTLSECGMTLRAQNILKKYGVETVDQLNGFVNCWKKIRPEVLAILKDNGHEHPGI